LVFEVTRKRRGRRQFIRPQQVSKPLAEQVPSQRRTVASSPFARQDSESMVEEPG
jgi:hypothetical protein